LNSGREYDMHVVLFDIDGTLVLTGGAGQHAFQLTFAEEFGVETISREVQFSGRSDRAIAMDLFRAHRLEVTPANWNRFRDGYIRRLPAALSARTGHVLPGVHALVDHLSGRDDVLIGLLTGNIRKAAERKLSHYNLWHHFPFGGFGDEHEDRCDIASAAVKAAHKHSTNGISGAVIVIGDTPNDIACARSIGAIAVAVATGGASTESLRDAMPDVLVETLVTPAVIIDLLN
jgi:phosphoglycolate phosphatase-like HAD superfamily hydrolase